jgi:pimeloyl-ACP methyl ester carboxylesterase
MPPIANIPTLLLWGGKDRAVDPTSAKELSRRLSNCESEIFEGVGHLPYEEVPWEFNSAVVKFLSRNERRAF